MKRILVVDDDPEATELLARQLKKLGYEVETVFSGADALEKFSQENFDVVISDVRMPYGSGIDLLRELQRLPKHVPVVLMSADTKGAKAQAKALGADAFLPKPLTTDGLKDVMHSLSI